MSDIPPLPEGATLDDDSGIPPLPPGATLDAPSAPRVAADPADDMSNVDKFLAGAGKGFMDTWRGIRQIGAKMGISSEKPEDIQAEIDEANRLDKPLMNTKMGTFGNIVAQGAPMLAAPGAGIIGSAVEGGLLGAAQPTVTGGASRLQNATLGAAGSAVGAGVGKVIGALGGYGVPMERQAAVRILDARGVPTSVAQKTASKSAQTVERSSAMLSDAPHDFLQNQMGHLNRAVMEEMGVVKPLVKGKPVPMPGSEVLESLEPGRKALGNTMDAIASRTNFPLDNQLLNDMAQVESDATRRLPASDIAPLKANISDILENATQNGHIDGQFYQKLNSNLTELSKNPSVAPLASDLRRTVNDALSRYANPDDVSLLAKTRGQYRAFKQIQNSVDNATGNISPSRLMNSIATRNNQAQALRGVGDQSLVRLARAAKAIIPDPLANSGTSERLLGPLTFMEIARSGRPFQESLKAGAAIASGGLMGKAMRNQGVVGKTLAGGVPGLRAVAPYLKDVAPALGYGAAQSQRDRGTPSVDEDGNPVTINRASGGKVDSDALVERLIKRWKDAKKATDRTTEPLLKVPDATIQKALNIAQEHI